MPTLLVAERDNASLKDATAKALTAAKALGADVHVLVAGHNCQAAAAAAAKLDGVAKVLLADAPAYDHMLAEPVAALTQAHRARPGINMKTARQQYAAVHEVDALGRHAGNNLPHAQHDPVRLPRRRARSASPSRIPAYGWLSSSGIWASASVERPTRSIDLGLL